MRKKKAYIERLAMDVTENKYITEVSAKLLVQDNWTMAKLATSQPGVLKKYKGIGMATAGKIVIEARRLINQHELNEAALHRSVETGQAEAVTDVVDEPPMSVRVRRIREQRQ